MKHRRSGKGGIFQRKDSAVWWIRFSNHGKRYRESDHSYDRAVASDLLDKRRGDVKAGKVQTDRLTFEDLAAIITDEYRANNRHSARRLGHALAHLREFFKDGYLARDITTDRATAYAAHRQDQGAGNGTINRELAALKRALRLAARAGKVDQPPYIAMLTESPARSGFFEREQFERVLQELPDYLRPVMYAAYLTGWRVPSELLTRQRHHLDLRAGTLRLDPGETKNGKARIFPLTAYPELQQLLEQQVKNTLASGQTVRWLFHRNGDQIKDYYVAWRAAVKRAGLPGRIPHDFRRAAVRNLERAGVSRSVAMKLTGHQTEAIYTRYAIVSESDLAEGVAKLAALHAADRQAPPITGEVLPFARKI